MSAYGRLWERARVIRMRLGEVLPYAPWSARDARDQFTEIQTRALKLIKELKELEDEMKKVEE